MASKPRSARSRKAPVTRSSPNARTATPVKRTTSPARGGRAVVPGQARGGARSADAMARADQEGPAPAEASPAEASAAAPAWLQWAAFVLALAGLGVSAYLTYTHFSEAKLLGCAESGVVNCQKVTTSAESYVFGIPVAVLGLAFYAFLVPVMSPWAWRMTRQEVHVARLAAITAGVGFVLYLLYAELYMIGSICLYCTAVHVITFLLFVLTVAAAAMWGLRPPARPAD